MSKITLNIVEPGSPIPDPVVPNTGLFTHGIGGPEATIILSVVLILAIVGIALATYMYRKHKKASKTTKLVHIIDSTKAVLKSKKRITAGLVAISLLVSACTFTAFMLNTNKNNTNAIEGEDSLTVNASDADLTIEVGDAPVFAVLPVEVTVEEATTAGYTLTAYTDSTDLVSNTSPDNKIPMVAVEGDELVVLKDNTYGLSLEEPTSKDEEVYTTLSTDQDNPTIIKSMAEYSPTEAEDKTTIYYGFYITPDIPYGTYTNDSEVHYDATINTTLVTFDGNDLYFNNDTEQTTNAVEYIAVAQEESEDTINQIISGEYKKPSQALPYNFLGWSEEQEATTPTYTSAEDIAQNLPILPNQPIILYAIWQKATTITFDNNGGTGTMTTQTIIAGESDNLYENTFTREGYIFTGWNTAAEPTEQEPGKAYADQAEYTAPADSGYVTLYAQWKVLPTLYDNVAAMNKGTQTLAQLQETITTPTTTDYAADTSNSGVYEYNSSVFGEASDASNANKIYYYRGVLEPSGDQGTYGSDGKATTYPNYVILDANGTKDTSDTCWRIVRTTGSGGVKMIYNGTWTGSTCANSTTDAQTTTQVFASKGTSSKSDWYKNIHYVGYTYNNTVTDKAGSYPIDTAFGSNSNPSLNNTRSHIKTYIEDTWYANNMTNYTSILEASAGYCNDRSAYSDSTTSTALTTIVPYQTSGATMYFGAYGRNLNATNAGKTPSLNCRRNTVDLYRYVSGSTGVANQLKYPAALLTADEVSLAGSGRTEASQGSSCNNKSFLNSGIEFWLLSPSQRLLNGQAWSMGLSMFNQINAFSLNAGYGVRPAISLKPGTTVESGTGIATDPWIVTAP